MKKIDIGQALANPYVAKALSEFTVGMMNNSDVTKILREAIAQDKDLKTSSKKLIEAIESYREKTIVDPSPKIIPRTPKYKKHDIVLYEDNQKNVFAAVINYVEPLSADYRDEPAYTITNILDPNAQRHTVESKLTNVADLNNLIAKYKFNIRTKNDHHGDIPAMLDSAVKKLEILEKAIKTRAPPPVAPPPVAPPPVAPPPNIHIPKYYENDIILYDDFDHETVFIAIVTNVDLKKGAKPIYTIKKMNSYEQPFIANEHNLSDVATLNTQIENLRKSLEDIDLTKDARSDSDNILKKLLNNHKMLVAAIKVNDNYEIGFKKTDWLSYPPKKLKGIVNKNNIDVFLSVMRAARVEQLVNMITNPTEEAKNLVKLDNIYINIQKQSYLNDITSEDDKKKFEDAMSFVREEGISNAEIESDPEAVIEKLLAMDEARKIIMTELKKDKATRLAQAKEKEDRDIEIWIRLEEMRKKEQIQKGGRRTKKTHYRNHITIN